jgi:ABC-type branched-subunit amino acid transport system ATPase component
MSAVAEVAAPILIVEDIYAGYQSGVDILQGLSLDVRHDGLTLVIGPNGAGKSTLLKAVFGFLRPHAGAVRFRGEQISALPPHAVKRRGIGYVTQEIGTFPQLSVEENLRMGGWLFRHDKARLRRRVEWAYAIFPQLAERRRVRAGELSGGQGRMLSVLREMMAEPELLLVDEPTAGLAPNLVDQVYRLLLDACGESGTAILLVDQNIEEAVPHADYVYMIDLGRVKAEGPRGEFGSERVAALIRECLLG